MKERLKSIIGADRSKQENLNLAREYLQHYVLYLLYRTKCYQGLAFTGGTALRILHGLPRFSEDLDFSCVSDESAEEFDRVRQVLQSELTLAGYDVQQKATGSGNVRGTFLKFPGLLHELGLSPHAAQVISVKVEVDWQPPGGARMENSFVNRYHLIYLVRHYDLPTLFAGKLHALLFRPYTKARDLYDLFWCLTTRADLSPNLGYLNGAAAQTQKEPPTFTQANWRATLLERLRGVHFARARREVGPFLEDPQQAELLTLETFEVLLGVGPQAPPFQPSEGF